MPTTRVLPFDQRQRYEVVSALVGALNRPCRLLDVGGFYLELDGTPQLPIRDMVPEARSFAVDLERRALPGYAVADAGQLPFADRSFDVVSCLDVLEHIPRHDRSRVIAELRRVARSFVVIAVPIADEGAAAREQALQRFILANLGTEQQQLAEHQTCGLPAHEEIQACLPAQTRSFGYGNLDRWEIAMLAKHFLLALPHHAEAFHLFDDRYGELDPRGDRRPPFYRRFYLTAVNPDLSLEPINAVCEIYHQIGEDDRRSSDHRSREGLETSSVLALTLETLIKTDAGRLAAERAPLQRQLADSQTHIQNLDGAMEDLKTAIRNQEQALADAIVHIRHLEAAIGDLKTQVARREETLRASQTHIGNLEAIVSNREQALEATRAHAANLEASLTSMQAHVDNLQTTLTAVEQSKVYRLYQLVNRLSRS